MVYIIDTCRHLVAGTDMLHQLQFVLQNLMLTVVVSCWSMLD